MDLEVREIETSKRQRCRTKLECYRAELKRLTLEYIKARSIKQVGYESADDLNDVRISNDQKQRLLDNSERIERTGRRLDEGYRVVLESQEIGTQVLQNLHEQRETIQRSRNRVGRREMINNNNNKLNGVSVAGNKRGTGEIVQNYEFHADASDPTENRPIHCRCLFYNCRCNRSLFGIQQVIVSYAGKYVQIRYFIRDIFTESIYNQNFAK